MTSTRYLILSIIYIVGSYYSNIKYNQYPTLIYNPLIILSISTFIFFFYIKYQENKCTDENNLKGLPTSYILIQSIFYTGVAILSKYIYMFFLDKECLTLISSSINILNNITYIPESLFIAGLVLLINHLSIYLYPKCN